VDAINRYAWTSSIGIGGRHHSVRPLERLLREIRRRTRVVGVFPDGQSALNLAAARLRYVAGSEWSTRRYLNMDLLREAVDAVA